MCKHSKMTDEQKTFISDNLHYNPETGHFTWTRPAQGRRVNGLAGGKDSKGYIRIRGMLAHRLAYWLMTGKEADVIDHIDGDCANNAWGNLRSTTQADNLANQHRHNNKTGYKGVVKNTGSTRYSATLMRHGKVYRLGPFDTPEEAHDARTSLAVSLRGDLHRV